MILDRPDDIKQVDKSGMLDALNTIPQQIEEGITLGKKLKLSACDINKIIIMGMGGSAFTGDVIYVLGRESIPFPLVVSKTYFLPNFADEKTLVMILSYSGNSEEALSSFRAAKQSKAQIFSIFSGGQLEQLSSEAHWYVKVPSGLQPRAAIAFLLYPSLLFLIKCKLLDVDEREIRESVKVTKELNSTINQHVPTQKNLAKRLAQDIQGKIPKIYGYGITAPIARRWRTQFNENSKLFAFNDEVPECNHNEIESWNGKNPYHYLFLRSRDEISAVKNRFIIMRELMENATELWAKGESSLAQMVYLMYLGDYVSTYLAILRGIDPSPVQKIEKIKKRLKLLGSAV